MRTYLKIFGPPLVKALRELEKVSIDMPKVCIMDSLIVQSIPGYEVSPRARGGSSSSNFASQYFSYLPISIPIKRCDTIISKSGEMLGDYDFFFEWFKDPTTEELNKLLEKIDEVLGPLGCKYTATTKPK